jgi:hypothetical protein
MHYFSIVVPLIPQHDSKLKSLFEGLASQNSLIKEVIICRSESFAPDFLLQIKFRLIARFGGLKAPIIINSFRGMARDGTNRNRGWLAATAPYVAFLDADDKYARNRIEIIHQALVTSNADAVLHDYHSQHEKPGKFEEVVFDKSKINNCQLAKIKDENEEFFAVCDQDDRRLQIHFAHLTLKTNLRDEMKFSDRFPAADAQMTQELLVNKKSMIYIDLKLSSWVRDRSIRYKIRLVRTRAKTHFTN